ncbi:MAG: MFS transporter [Pseudobdellovibrionaceae bacterium]
MRKLFGNRTVMSWALYDWANSSFATTVMAGFFPLFFQLYWSKGADPAVTTAKLGTTVSIASFAIAILAPFLGAAADLRGLKKKFLFVFCVGGVIFSASLGFVPQGEWLSAAITYGAALLCFTATIVFYDSLLPSVAKGNEDEVSAFGFGLGYLGGGILLAINVLMMQRPALFGFESEVQGILASFISVAIWWAVFSIPLFLYVPEPGLGVSTPSETHIFTKIFEGTKKTLSTVSGTLGKIKSNRNLFTFLIAYWLYIDGVYTVITMAVNHGVAIGLKPAALITALLITQFIGFPSALVFGKVARPFGCKKPILFAILVYFLVVIYSVFLETELEFLILAAVIGLVQGGVQALSRSLFSRMIPSELSAEYFGFFNLIGKFASIVGPAIVAIGAYVTGSSRYGILGLLVLFILGGTLLLTVKEQAHQ